MKCEDGGGDGECGRRGLTYEVAGDGAEGHCEEHCYQAHGCTNDAKERLCLELLERLERVRVDWRDCSNERRGDDDKTERALDDADALKEGGEKDARGDDRDEEENCGRGKYAAHQGFELAEFLVYGKTGQLIAEGVGKCGDWNREEVGELGKRHHRAELGRVDVLWDEPQADKCVQEVGCAAGAEKHQRIPPEIAEPSVES